MIGPTTHPVPGRPSRGPSPDGAAPTFPGAAPLALAVPAPYA